MVSGSIDKVSPDYITLSGQNIPVDEIERISFGDDPSKFSSVRSAVKNGQLVQAKADLQKVKAGGRDFVQQDIAFYRALIDAKLALQGKGDVRQSARAIGAFLKANPDSFRYYEACETMGLLAQSLESFDNATRYFSRLTKSRSPGLAARGSLLLGDAFLLKGDAKRAKTMFERCGKSPDLRLKTMGDVGKAACLALNGATATEAISILEKVIDENDSSDVELFSRAYNALGQAYLATGKTESALDAFLHTDLLFYRNSEKHAEALFHLSKLWSDVNKPSEANNARNKLKQRYPSTVWAKK